MKHVQMRYQECALAVTAMFTGKRLTKIRGDFLRYARKRLTPDNISDELYMQLLERLLSKYGLSYPVTYSARAWRMKRTIRSIRRAELTGRGCIVITLSNNYSHIVVFEDGKIYDPSEPKSLTLGRWKNTYQNLNCKVKIKSM